MKTKTVTIDGQDYVLMPWTAGALETLVDKQAELGDGNPKITFETFYLAMRECAEPAVADGRKLRVTLDKINEVIRTVGELSDMNLDGGAAAGADASGEAKPDAA